MTYGVGMLVRDGLVMMADTRTNAGIDDVASHRKLYIFDVGGARSVAIAVAGSLSVTQAALALLRDGVTDPEGGQATRLSDCTCIVDAAYLVGRAIVETRRDFQAATDEGVKTGARMLLGGRIGAEPLRLFLIYQEGNWIEADCDTPFLQVGEHKYGKPIMDRALTCDTDVRETLKLGLLSMDATMRSNLSVGLPLDVVAFEPGGAQPLVEHRIEHHDPYFSELGARWAAALIEAERSIPPPPY